MKARPAGSGMSLSEALEQSVELRDWTELLEYLKRNYPYWAPTAENVTVEDYGPDDRTGWRTHLVCIAGKATLFSDGMPEGIPEAATRRA